ncbi:MAG: hypothetical protein KC620_13640, partial [Myxococcales bacterium]|nr:hypothetical protein [Myxococcales bacterium]
MDGNRLTDLAIQLTDGAVLVHYGAPDGGFGAPQVIGRFATNAVWTLGRLASDRGVDATDDLVIYADDRLYRFAGSAQQQLTAPIAHMNRPQGVAIGRFADGPGVLVVGRTNDNRRRDSELDAAEVGAADPQLREVGTFGCAPDTQGANATLRVVDWDGDGVNEVVQFDHIDADGEENIAVQWLDVTADAVRCRLIAQVALPGFPLAFDRVDLDGDGNDEVVALVRQPNGPLNVIIWPLDGETPGAPVVIEPELRIEQATVLDLGGGPQWIAIADGALHRTRWVDGALV